MTATLIREIRRFSVQLRNGLYFEVILCAIARFRVAPRIFPEIGDAGDFFGVRSPFLFSCLDSYLVDR